MSSKTITIWGNAAFFIVPVILAILVSCNLPFSLPTQVNYDTAQELLSYGRIQSNFLPIGYSEFVAIGLGLGGKVGVIICQAMVYFFNCNIWIYFIKDFGAFEGKCHYRCFSDSGSSACFIKYCTCSG